MRSLVRLLVLGAVLAAITVVAGCGAPPAARSVAPCWLEVHRGSFQRRYPHVPDARVFPGDGSHVVAFCGPASSQDRSKLERSLRAASVTATELGSGQRRRLSLTGRHQGVMASPLGSLVSGCIGIGELPTGRWSIRVSAGPDIGGVRSAESGLVFVRIAPPEGPRERRAMAWRGTQWWNPSDATVQALTDLLSSIDADPAASNAERFMVQVHLAHVLLLRHRAEEALRYGREAEVTAGALGDAELAAARQMQACAEIMMQDSTLSNECRLAS